MTRLHGPKQADVTNKKDFTRGAMSYHFRLRAHLAYALGGLTYAAWQLRACVFANSLSSKTALGFRLHLHMSLHTVKLPNQLTQPYTLQGFADTLG